LVSIKRGGKGGGGAIISTTTAKRKKAGKRGALPARKKSGEKTKTREESRKEMKVTAPAWGVDLFTGGEKKKGKIIAKALK